jgi:phage baseplate assembly protein W
VIGGKRSLRFENIDEFSASTIRDEIDSSLRNYEPRIILDSVIANPNYDNNAFDVIINYRIVGVDISAQRLEFVLLPTR